ncbi:hypothetical protein CEXT_209711, partial [Caerostris extrusa]
SPLAGMRHTNYADDDDDVQQCVRKRKMGAHEKRKWKKRKKGNVCLRYSQRSVFIRTVVNLW